MHIINAYKEQYNKIEINIHKEQYNWFKKKKRFLVKYS